ncbi:MAG: hypothetical protein ACYTJ0_01405 [Planctomycetota bacterium]|jgi:hypothetical protein
MPRPACLLVIALLIGTPGCRTASSPAPSPTTGSEWPFWPTAMRIHPLTRLVTAGEAGGPLVEVRVEFVDRDGITTRAFGEVQIELLPSARRPSEPLAWRVHLDDLATNAMHFDDITRTYLFKLGLEEQDLTGPRELRVTLFGSDAREFVDRMTVETSLDSVSGGYSTGSMTVY